MKKIGKYFYADSGKKLIMTAFGFEQKEVRKAFSQLETPEDGLGKVPASWVDKEYVVEVQR